MPKIIENLREKLVLEARHQVEELGYGALTIRSVAAACGVGVGTVYNYFSSKDALVAAFMLEDWQQCTAAIDSTAQQSETAAPVLRCAHQQLLEFIQRQQAIFSDEAAVAGFSGSPSPYHSMLRSQLARPLLKFVPDDFTAEFIAEALLTWTVAGRGIEDILPLFEKLL
jgi:AcrR family transcriptional regulator